MPGGRPRRDLKSDRAADEAVRQAVADLTSEPGRGRDRSSSGSDGVTPHLVLATAALRIAAAAERAARRHVALARETEGTTWEQVGEAFGTSRQSAHERFRSL